jgi:flagella basal body P-ring formation protein FlgA
VRSLLRSWRTTAEVIGLVAIAVLAYLQFHHTHTQAKPAPDIYRPITVLVAKVPIAKGTVGNVIANRGLYAAETIRLNQALKGVFIDPSSRRDKVAAHDILRGSQLTAAEFTRCACVSSPPNITP